MSCYRTPVAHIATVRARCQRYGLGMVHGGAVFTLADYAFAVACNSHGHASLAINASISYLKGAKGALLCALAEEVAVDGKLGSCLVRVVDEDGTVVAMFQGLSYKKGLAGGGA